MNGTGRLVPSGTSAPTASQGVTMTRRGTLRACAAAVLTHPLAGCTGGGGDGERTVAMTDDLRFEPKTVSVSLGERVSWVNEGTVPHTVTAYVDAIPAGAAYFASGGYASERAARNDVQGGLLREGDRYSHTVEVAGTYEYFCIPHEGSEMVGTVRVR